MSVADDGDELLTSGLRGKFQAAENVRVHDIAGDAGVENIADALIENQFRTGARVEATDDGGEWKLAVARFVNLFQVIAACGFTSDEARIARLEVLEGLLRSRGGLRFLRHGDGARRQAGTTRRDEREAGDGNVEDVFGFHCFVCLFFLLLLG